MKNTPELKGLTLYYAIRARFPRPGSGRLQEGYCVGGALFKFMHSFAGAAFPSQVVLGDTLMQANPKLPSAQAYQYAWRIISRNDIGAYEDAWGQLKAALTDDGQANNAHQDIVEAELS